MTVKVSTILKAFLNFILESCYTGYHIRVSQYSHNFLWVSPRGDEINSCSVMSLENLPIWLIYQEMSLNHKRVIVSKTIYHGLLVKGTPMMLEVGCHEIHLRKAQLPIPKELKWEDEGNKIHTFSSYWTCSFQADCTSISILSRRCWALQPTISAESINIFKLIKCSNYKSPPENTPRMVHIEYFDNTPRISIG